MTIRPILRFPDPRLREIAQLVDTFDDELRALAADLADTLRAASGLGITASHLGVAKRLVAVALAPDADVRVFVNPRLTWVAAETTVYPEGSLSMPGVREEIRRPARVRVAFQDLDGKNRDEEADGLLAVCLQHEIDQLDGIFWIDRLWRLKRERLIRRYDKLQRAGKQP